MEKRGLEPRYQRHSIQLILTDKTLTSIKLLKEKVNSFLSIHNGSSSKYPPIFGPRNTCSNMLYIISIKTSAYAVGRKEFKAALNRKYLCPRKTFAKVCEGQKKDTGQIVANSFHRKFFFKHLPREQRGAGRYVEILGRSRIDLKTNSIPRFPAVALVVMYCWTF